MGAMRKTRIVLMGDKNCGCANINLHFVRDQMQATITTSDIKSVFEGCYTLSQRNTLVSRADVLVVFLGGSEKYDVALEIGMHVERRLSLRKPILVLISPQNGIPECMRVQVSRGLLSVYTIRENIPSIVERIVTKTKLS